MTDTATTPDTTVIDTYLSTWNETDPTARANSRLHFVKNVSMLGGLLLASVDTDGKPGMAWRARHAATDVRRQAKHLRREAKSQARLAAKSVTS